MPTALNRVLNVVRRLIEIGQQLIATVHQRAAAPDFWLFAKPFGTKDLALIIARITGGLRRAAALEAMLCQRAARGQDVTPSPSRMPATGKPPSERQLPPPAAQPEPQPDPTPAQDPRLARLPPEAEIAADIRRRPIGAVIVSICEDLGITPGPTRPSLLGRTRPRHHRLWRQPFGLPHPNEQPAVRHRSRQQHRPQGPILARTTATATGPHHRPALKAEPNPTHPAPGRALCAVRDGEPASIAQRNRPTSPLPPADSLPQGSSA
jgi:hypothetical protein